MEEPAPPVTQAHMLSVLARVPAETVKQFAEALLPELGTVTVVTNRTGLVMVPMHEPAQGTAFYLGEVLVSEAHVRLDQSEGYAACLGRDLQQVLAIALLDAAYTGEQARPQIAAFVAAQAEQQKQADTHLLRQVAATRVNMETF
jgi:alpha-D-ribose 1-methylphosphonate 5-triphosphate synthase subunit PhnG